MAKTLNVGLVGYKFMGKAHSNAYRQVNRFFEALEYQPCLKAICGRDEEGVRQASHVLGWESWETDWRRLLARDDIDIVDVSTPGHLHAEIAIAAALAGKMVFCEKPMGNTLDEARRMWDAVREAGVKHAVFFNYRKVPAVALAKQMIAEGALGQIYHWRGTYLQDWIADPNFPLVWRLKKETGGSGVHGDLNAHLIDMARFLVGEIVEVAGALETFVKERPEPMGDHMGQVTVPDAAMFLARFVCGALGTFEATRFALGRKNFNRFEINGAKGSLVFNMERPNELQVYTEDTREGTFGFRTVSVTTGADPYSGHYWPAGHNTGYEHTFVNLIADALAAIGKGENPSPNFYDGYVNNVVLDAVERAALSRKWEAVTVKD